MNPSPRASRLIVAGGLALGLVLASGLVARLDAAPARAATLPVAINSASPAAIVVTGTGTIDVTPDVARLTIAIQTTATTATEAEASNATASDRVRSQVTRAGIAPSDIKTLSLQVWPQYDYRSGQSVLTGFTASNVLQLTVHDLRRIGTAIDAAIAGGATSVQGITYDVTDHSAASAHALSLAVKDAQTKAEAMANAAGIRLGSVVSMTDNQTTPYPFPIIRAAAPTTAGATTQVSPPDVQLRVSVTVGWTIG